MRNKRRETGEDDGMMKIIDMEMDVWIETCLLYFIYSLRNHDILVVFTINNCKSLLFISQ